MVGKPSALEAVQRRRAAVARGIAGFDLVVVARVGASEHGYGRVDVVHKVLARFGHGEEVVALAHGEHGHGVGRRDGVVHDDGVHLAGGKRVEKRIAAAVIAVVAADALSLDPLLAHLGLHDVGVDADGHAVERGRVARPQRVVGGFREDVIVLLALRGRREQQLLGALGRVGDVGHQVDLAVLQLLYKFGEGAGDVLVFPAGCVVGQRLQVLVAPAGHILVGHAVLEALVAEQPAHAHGLDLGGVGLRSGVRGLLLGGSRAKRRQRDAGDGQYRAQRKRGGASANGAERVQLFQDGLPQMISAEAMQKRF